MMTSSMIPHAVKFFKNLIYLKLIFTSSGTSSVLLFTRGGAAPPPPPLGECEYASRREVRMVSRIIKLILVKRDRDIIFYTLDILMTFPARSFILSY